MYAGGVSTSSQWIRAIFRTPVSLSAATTYHLVLQGNYAASGTVHIRWVGLLAGGYANGKAHAYDGTTWADDSNVLDFDFKTYITRNDASVTMPAGYTKKAKIGYVYNNSGSNLNLFVAKDNRVVYGNLISIGSLSATIPTLCDFSFGLPPGPISVYAIGQNSTADVTMVISNVPDGYDDNVFRVLAASSTAGVDAAFHGFVTEFQAVYFRTSAGTSFIRIHGFEW
jgi:hypothetical protein